MFTVPRVCIKNTNSQPAFYRAIGNLSINCMHNVLCYVGPTNKVLALSRIYFHIIIVLFPFMILISSIPSMHGSVQKMPSRPIGGLQINYCNL